MHCQVQLNIHPELSSLEDYTCKGRAEVSSPSTCCTLCIRAHYNYYSEARELGLVVCLLMCWLTGRKTKKWSGVTLHVFTFLALITDSEGNKEASESKIAKAQQHSGAAHSFTTERNISLNVSPLLLILGLEFWPEKDYFGNAPPLTYVNHFEHQLSAKISALICS